ncbi:amidohydrolase [Xanthobacter sp. 126]|uniref:amidohydrolase n=1 Tax=Xanthobacter sp. 126 TaxID=1131814 RepID=UPI0004B1E755|nr:amidohydrolase [Xanthobacter sp. 126]
MDDVIETCVAWRHHLHANPELLYDLPGTTRFVSERLVEAGVDRIETGIGGSGIVALIGGAGTSGRVVGLRADMDALPISEATGLPYASRAAGRMHACGHDGHTAMLLGAARRLAATRDFSGTVALVFQPAEEGGAGARAMIDDGVLDRFGIAEIYGLHAMPALPVGHFATRAGPLMAASDLVTITLGGRGGHAGAPHLADDVVLAGAAIVQAVQRITARTLDPIESAVVSLTCFQAGERENVIPATATIRGTVRALHEPARRAIEERLCDMVPKIAAGFGVAATVLYRREYPATVNAADQVALAVEVAGALVGGQAVDSNARPILASEDFADFLAERPGAFTFIGNGDSAPLHSPRFDFADAAIPFGIDFLCRVAAAALAQDPRRLPGGDTHRKARP